MCHFGHGRPLSEAETGSQMKASSIIRNVTSNWANLVLNIVISFFLAPYVVDKLGSTYYGIWAVTMQFTSYLYLLDFGVRESVVRHTSKFLARGQSRALNSVISTALLIYAPVSVACLALAGICALLMPGWVQIAPDHVGEARIVTMLVGSTVATAFVFNVFTGVLIGFQRFELTNAVGIFLTITRTVLVVALLSEGYGIIALAAAQFTIGVAGGIVFALLARSLLGKAGMPFALPHMRWRHRVRIARQIGGYGWYVLVNNVGQKAIFGSSAIIVGIFLPITSVTFYVIASNLCDYLRMLIQSASQVFNPLTSRLRALGRQEEIGQLLIRGTKATVIVALPVGIVYAVLGRRFIDLWMGEEFGGPASDVLLVLAITQVFSAPHHIVSGMLYGLGKHKIIALIRIAEGFTNVTLSVLLVQRFGLVGVALGTAISHLTFVLLVLPVRVRSVLRFELSRYFMRTYAIPMAAAIPMLLATQWCRINLFPSNLVEFFAEVAALSAIYSVSVYFIALDCAERAIVIRLARPWVKS
jgi:O-antigen/teichoic acid export membrane protein